MYTGSALVTMAQAARALDDAYGDTGQVRDHIGAMILGLTGRLGEVLGGSREVRYTEELLLREMGINEMPAQTQLYVAMPNLMSRATALVPQLLALSTTNQDESFDAFTRSLAPVYGFDSATDAIPEKIAVICQHAALTMVTTNEDTLDRGKAERNTRLEVTAVMEAQLLVMWRLSELALLQMGKTPGYDARPEPPDSADKA